MNLAQTAALGRWVAKILILVGEAFGERQRRARLSVLFAVIEPFGVIAVFAMAHSLVFHRPAFGTSTLLFLSTGILPFYLFIHISWRARAWDTMRILPRASRVDMMAAGVIAETLTKVIIICVAYAGLSLYGVSDAIPQAPLVCLAALAVLATFGLGVGLVNAVIVAFFPPWSYFYAIALRAWMVFSGVLYVADRMPPTMRAVVMQNPLAHAITLYRSGHYANYPTLTLDVEFLLTSTAIAVALGVLVIDGTKRWRPSR